jgi:hypothetical protein
MRMKPARQTSCTRWARNVATMDASAAGVSRPALARVDDRRRDAVLRGDAQRAGVGVVRDETDDLAPSVPAAAAAARDWKFEPRPEANTPTRTIAVTCLLARMRKMTKDVAFADGRDAARF